MGKFNSRESRISKVVRGNFIFVVYFCEILSQPYFKETYLFPPIIFSHISNSKKMELISTIYILGVRDHKKLIFCLCLTLLVNINFSAKMSANKLNMGPFTNYVSKIFAFPLPCRLVDNFAY